MLEYFWTGQRVDGGLPWLSRSGAYGQRGAGYGLNNMWFKMGTQMSLHFLYIGQD